MNIFQKFLSVTLLTSCVVGCSSTSVHHFGKPDMNQPLSENETLITMQRVEHYIGGANNTIASNDKLIGEIANGDTLSWKVKANEFQCISTDWNNILKTLHEGFILEDNPLALKCIYTEPMTKMELIYDPQYPETRIAQPIAFVTLYKTSPTFKQSDTVSMRIVNSVPMDKRNDLDFEALLSNAFSNQFGDKESASSDKIVEMEILDYKSGNAVGRWFAQSLKGATYAKVKVIVKDSGQVVEQFITRPVISSGGLYTAGGDEYIFEEVTEDIYLHLFGNE
jgi:hypothetical protein